MGWLRKNNTLKDDPRCSPDYDMEEEFMKNQRDEFLDKEFNQQMPCKDCKLSPICRYVGTFKRINYDKDVFNVEITCKLKDTLV